MVLNEQRGVFVQFSSIRLGEGGFEGNLGAIWPRVITIQRDGTALGLGIQIRLDLSIAKSL